MDWLTYINNVKELEEKKNDDQIFIFNECGKNVNYKKDSPFTQFFVETFKIFEIQIANSKV